MVFFSSLVSVAETIETQYEPNQHGSRGARWLVLSGDVTFGKMGERLYMRCYLILYENYLFWTAEITRQRLEI